MREDEEEEEVTGDREKEKAVYNFCPKEALRRLFVMVSVLSDNRAHANTAGWLHCGKTVRNQLTNSSAGDNHGPTLQSP